MNSVVKGVILLLFDIVGGFGIQHMPILKDVVVKRLPYAHEETPISQHQ
jgi:hypothetical protein